MADLNKLRTILAVVFAACLVALIADVIYILWRKRRFLRQHPTGDVELGQEEDAKLPSKELLYFFCWKSQTIRVEPADHSSSELYAERGSAPPLPPPKAEAEEDDDVLEKWKKEQVFIGPSRVLFTITEEEREGSAFSEDDAVLGSKVSNSTKKVVMLGRSRSGSIEEVEVEFDADVDVDVDLDDMTPFWTPCASPAYYTPSPSPSRDENLSRKMGPKDDVVLRPV